MSIAYAYAHVPNDSELMESHETQIAATADDVSYGCMYRYVRKPAEQHAGFPAFPNYHDYCTYLSGKILAHSAHHVLYNFANNMTRRVLFCVLVFALNMLKSFSTVSNQEDWTLHRYTMARPEFVRICAKRIWHARSDATFVSTVDPAVGADIPLCE